MPWLILSTRLLCATAAWVPSNGGLQILPAACVNWKTGRWTWFFWLQRTRNVKNCSATPVPPLFLTRSAVVVRKSHPLSRVGAMEQLRGLTLGHAHASIIPAYFDGLDIRFQSIAGDDYFNRGLKMLELGRHDAYYAPTLSNAQYLVKRMGGTQQFNVLELPGDALGLYVVFSKTMDENMYSRMDTLLRDNVARYRDLLGPYIR